LWSAALFRFAHCLLDASGVSSVHRLGFFVVVADGIEVITSDLRRLAVSHPAEHSVGPPLFGTLDVEKKP